MRKVPDRSNPGDGATTDESPSEPRRRDAADHVAFLAGSPIRSRILRELRERRLIERDLRDALDEPRSTVHRNVEKLAERGWIEECHDGYRTTWFGTAVLEQLDRTVDNVACVQRLGPFFDHVPVEAVAVDALGDVAVTTPEPNRPFGAMERVQEHFAESDSVRGVVPYLVPRLADEVRAWVRDGEREVEAVLSDAAAEALASGYDDCLREPLRGDDLSLYRYDGTVPYALLFAGDGVLLGSFDADGVPRTVVETDHGDAIAWAEATYRRYRSDATPITAADFGR